MTNHRLLDLVDSRDFRTLFIDELGWNNPDKPERCVDIDGESYSLIQIAGYKGLRIWHCRELPPRKVQRQIDVLIGQDNHERLVIFSNDSKQEWRWPRRAQLGSANAKLLIHEHLVGDRTTHLTQRLEAIELDFDEDITLVALLKKMRGAFDHEAETASVAAARLMGTLYTELDRSGLDAHTATLVLARLLFLLFGDDADMWKPSNLFETFIKEGTTEENLHDDLGNLFEILDMPEDKRPTGLSLDLAKFRYINGGLYSEPVKIQPLTSQFRAALIESCEFDWSIISPAVFGSMFQTVKSKVERRAGGEHYTTEENILRTIRPLFLDELTDRFESSRDDKAQLTKLHQDLGQIRLLDPACGCGNFLIVAYRELRHLELEILIRRRDLDLRDGTHIKTAKKDRAQLSMDVTSDLLVTLDHFFGIEIDDWPARIAETAMLLVDHLANERMRQEFGEAPDRLPIALAPRIVRGNALTIDWDSVVPVSPSVIVLGNPPFIGERWRSKELTEQLKAVWGTRMNAQLDYVTAWYKKTVDYYGKAPGSWAFVSTSSICQGEPVASLFSYIQDAGWHIKFAHQTFAWKSETQEAASVHCVIVGFQHTKPKKATLFSYANLNAQPTHTAVKQINAYLVSGPEVLVAKRTRPISPALTALFKGSYPTDGGYLTMGPDEIEEFRSDPVAKKYIRRFIGSRELLNGQERWCLWLKEMDERDVSRSELLRIRLEGVRTARLASTKIATQKKARTPHLFDEDRQPSIPYLAIPVHSSDSRDYLPCGMFNPDVICYAANFIAPDPDGFLFGIISSSMFIAWMRAVGGRIKSDLRLSNTLTFNTFPLDAVGAEKRQDVIAAGRGVMEARKTAGDVSLAKLYDPEKMPFNLKNAHTVLDTVVDELFGLTTQSTSKLGRQQALFKSYSVMTGQRALL